jgi:hypothetical protein
MLIVKVLILCPFFLNKVHWNDNITYLLWQSYEDTFTVIKHLLCTTVTSDDEHFFFTCCSPSVAIPYFKSYTAQQDMAQSSAWNSDDNENSSTPLDSNWYYCIIQSTDKIFGKPGRGLLVFSSLVTQKRRHRRTTGVVTTCRTARKQHSRCSSYMHVGQKRTQ